MNNGKMFTSPVKWARMGLVSFFLAKRFKMQEPPVLILSLPRSGSSWVSEILGSSTNALYLREPMTQGNLAIDESQPAEIYIDPVKPLKMYKNFADMAFAGIPVFRRGIVIYPEQWIFSKRKNRRLVIKEVNLLATTWLLRHYHPRVIFLVRHPAAVAFSYLKLGWLNINIKDIFFSCEELIEGSLKKWKDHLKSIESSFWQRHGAMQGAVLRFAFDSLNIYPEHKIILYEDLCSKPIEIFQELFDFAYLSWDKKIEKLIADRSIGGNMQQPYSTSRRSKDMINIWKGKISENELNRLRNAYCAFDLPWYRSSDDWQ